MKNVVTNAIDLNTVDVNVYIKQEHLMLMVIVLTIVQL